MFCLFVTGCATIETYPKRACLYDANKRWSSGTIIEKRGDGARLFRYDDPHEGDHGYRWVEEGEPLGPCKGPSLMDGFNA